jgi:outer membrane protein
MKKVLLALNIILLIAVAVLFYLYYQYTASDKHKIAEANAAANNNFKIAYFDLDSLENNYVYSKEVRDFLKQKDQQATNKLNNLRNTYIAKAKEFNQKGPTLSQTEQSQYQQELQNMDNDFQQQQQNLSQEMNAISLEKMQAVKAKIQDFLKTYCKEKGYTYVFASNDNDYLYYKDTIRNITDDIVKQLNDLYSKEKKK